LFCAVSEAVARATAALIEADVALGLAVVGADKLIDEQTGQAGRQMPP
jgi:hypothetical protein